ncbi:glycosyltransferase family 2 protein [Rhizobium etli]|uniref:glycosyltransferase family 2 protein n=1 Tax=Rhizobium etli TaxID=29449 RepID=UPI00038395DC|nr:glycosyltransferase family A protein [Rhizobium etli]AGS25652.1 glycosyltransferase family 2 protein [Rhizobium etli bv. mimosae str. Mim1]
MLTAVVMPCLNERGTLEASLNSLRTASGKLGSSVFILVDNGSTDGTLDVMRAVKERAAPNEIIVCEEPVRGYVPARCRGIVAAADIARQQDVTADKLLILQVDADTLYDPGYVAAMQAVASAQSNNVLLEGTTHPPHRFLKGHPGFVDLANETDEALGDWIADDSEDVVIDDKVSGFFYSAYLNWGGHQRDYDRNGHEIFAETSRLFLRGKRTGAQHVRVGTASAAPSRRKILRNPVRHFATAGFPRNNAWWREWNSRNPGARDLATFEASDSKLTLEAAVRTRQAHVVGLFWLLPLLVKQMCTPSGGNSKMGLGICDAAGPIFNETLNEPGTLLDRVLHKVDEWAANTYFSPAELGPDGRDRLISVRPKKI